MPRFLALFTKLLLVSVLGMAATASAQGGVERKGQFFRPLSAAAVVASAKVSNAAGVRTQAIPVQLDASTLFSLRYLDEVQLTLPTGIAHTVIFELAQDHGGGIASWVGYLKGHGNENRVIVTSGPAGSYGVIDAPEGSYRIVPGGVHDWLVDMTQEQLYLPIRSLGNDAVMPPPGTKSVQSDPDRAAFQIAIPGVNSVGFGKAKPTPQAIIDLMFVVTKGLADNLGANLATRLNFMVTRANTAYTDSEIAITLRLVNFTIVNYSDSTTDNAALGAITPNGSGFNSAAFGTIETVRNAVGADMVAVLRNGDAFGGSGLAWVGSTAPDPSIMYSVTTGCVSGCESVYIHELGHNMGNMHDRKTVAWQDGGTTTPSPGAFPYSFGYVFCKSGAITCNPDVPGGCSVGPECSNSDKSNFRDIMAYFGGTANDTYKFSNPAVNCVSTATGADAVPRPCGVSESSPASANNALSMNNNRVALSAIKATVVASSMPGSLQFTQTGYSSTEAGGSVTFTVSRSGGSGGAVSVRYSLSSGTATAGVDFDAGGGTLTWADGDSANKTFTVALANDLAQENVEAFTATLSDAAGAPGAYIGSPSTATALILETWPPGAVMPDGFVTPDGSSGAWTVATDQAYEGTHSVRSAQVFGNGDFSTYSNSDLTFSGTLQAGVISFAYRVSSYQGMGVFEFQVDGATVLSDTGETGWKTYFHNLTTAGTHTLKFRFKNRIPGACNAGWDPPPAGGAACADRVWIDAVSLPVVLTASTTSLASSANPATTGQAVTLTATVAGAPGSLTGTVAFRDGTTVITGCSAIIVTAGTTACTTSSLAVGTRSITAAYSGSTTHATSTSAALTQTVVGIVALTVTKTGTGTGTVTSSPTGINCGTTCTANFNGGSTVTLTAAASAGSVFTGWSGGGCTGLGTCATTLGAATTVTATFTTLAGTPTALAIPTSRDFGGQSMRTTAPSQTVTLLNVGTGTLTVISVTSSTTQFAQTNNCATLATGASCTVTLAFTPTAQGALSGTLTLVTNGGTQTVTLTGTGEKSLVTHYYRSILRRAPDTGGKTFWDAEATRVQALGANVNEVWYAMAGSFYFSSEYLAFSRDNAGFVTDLYGTFFNRAPDTGGFNDWTGQLAAGMPREVVLASFMFSTEFATFTQAIFGTATTRKEIDTVGDFYRGLLARLPDDGGFNFWLAQFRAAQCQGASAVTAQAESISSQFAQGSEYAARVRSDAQYVGDLYNAFLRRGGDLAGVQFWISQVATGARTRENVRQAFVGSTEFSARVAAVIAQGCLP